MGGTHLKITKWIVISLNLIIGRKA